jgi:hypothetical protein
MRGSTLAAVAAVIAVAAVVAVNVLLLGHGVARHDPVGQLSPVVAGFGTTTSPARPPTTTVTRSGEPDD